MFFKKRREAKKAAADELRQSIVDSFQQRIDEAGRLPDPADRILKLQEVANDVDDVVAELSGKAAMSAEKKRKLLVWTAVPSGIVASAVYPPALLGLLGMGASVYGGRKLGKVFAERAEKKALEKERPFINALTIQKEKAFAAQDALVITDAPRIASSPLFTDVLAASPRLRDQFAQAYGRKIADEAAPKPQPGSKRRNDEFRP